MTALTAGERVESVTLIGDNEPHWCAEISTEDERDASVVWTEALTFHVGVRRLLELVDVDGDIDKRVPEILERELRRLLGNQFVSVVVSDQDERALEVEVPFTVEPATQERLAELAWPVVATLTNVFDPGTFNAEYVMGNVAQKMGE